MQNTFQQITEIIENLKLTSGKDARLSQIEKDIVLEKMRNLYLEISQMNVLSASDEFAQKAAEMEAQRAENERRAIAESEKRKAEETAKIQEYEALLLNLENNRKKLYEELQHLESERKHLEEVKMQQVAELKQLAEQSQALKQKEQKTVAPKENYAVQQGMTEDVDLFFDMDHESYGPTEEHLPIQDEPMAADVKAAPVQQVQSKPEPKPESKPAPKVEPEPVSDEDDLLQFMPQSRPEPKKEVKPVQKEQHQPQHIAAPSSSQRSLNDLFNAQKEDNSLGAQFQRAKVGDLTKAISINEKFTFIKELFNNKGEEFSESIQKLNQCATMEDAFNCLESLKKHYFWDSTSTAYLSLCDLLRRKFM